MTTYAVRLQASYVNGQWVNEVHKPGCRDIARKETFAYTLEEINDEREETGDVYRIMNCAK